MTCPYNCSTITQVTQCRYEYDEEGRNEFYEIKLVEDKEYLECKEENCAVWYDGRCHYNG